jgi:hypothetical protein
VWGGVAWGAQATFVGEALTLVPCFVSHKRTAVAWAEALQRLPNWIGGRHEAVLSGDHRPKRGAAQQLLSTRACLIRRLCGSIRRACTQESSAAVGSERLQRVRWASRALGQDAFRPALWVRARGFENPCVGAMVKRNKSIRAIESRLARRTRRRARFPPPLICRESSSLQVGVSLARGYPMAER